MAARYPRVECPFCDRVVAGAPTKRLGIISLMDHKKTPHTLVLCPGSMHHMQAPDAKFVQEMLQTIPEPAPPPEPAPEILPLF